MTDDVHFEIEPDPLTRALRESLARHADDAPPADLLAERIVAAAAGSAAPGTVAPPRPPRRSRRRSSGRPPGRSWRTWSLPLAAAVAVAAVVAAAVGIENLRPQADKAPPATSGSVSVSVAPSTSAAPSSAAPSATTSAPPPDTSSLHQVQVLDLTFAGADDGWALASARCIHGPGRCPALMRTKDGATWHSVGGVAFNVPDASGSCADPCVEHLRFANDWIGYAFGPRALFMTTDGGSTWQQQPGLGADALETLSDNAIFVGSRVGGTGRCANGCPVVMRAPIGSAAWTAVGLPGGAAALSTGPVYLARARHTVMILVSRFSRAKGFRHPGILYRSLDDGATWHRRGDPCPYVAADYADDSVSLAVGGDGSVVVGCVAYQANFSFYGGTVITSTDGGASFVTPSSPGKLGQSRVLGAADANHVFAYADASGRATETRTRFYGSAGPLPWNLLPDITGEVTFVGFESTSVGRVVADGGRTIWTTRDAGVTWRPVRLP